MNLNVSYNWLKSYVKTNLTPQEFAKKISLSGPSVDRINIVKPNFAKVVVGQIKKIDNHPNADKLHVCQVNVGPHGVKTATPEGKQEELQIVCGAPNILVGQKVPVVLVGGKVGDFEIKPAKIRDVQSFGMMCSQKELGIGDDHSGIFILPEYVEVGQALEKLMPLDDAIMDIEVTSNRPDAMCAIGIAREAAAILQEKFLYHEPKPNLSLKGEAKKLAVKVAQPKLCPRYQAVVMTGVKVEKSPLWMQQRLLASGIRPINNLVDITNYILLEYGQPMHVFDYEKLNGNEINVRLAKDGENILALDGKEYELFTDQLVIADKTAPVAVAGVMGGQLSAATEGTNTIVFECANFDAVSVRKTSRALNLRSESSALYEKSLSPENVPAAMLRAIELAQEIAGTKVASKIIDESSYKHKAITVKLTLAGVARLLGVEIKAIAIKDYLAGLGFVVKAGKKKDEFEVVVPWWRENDILGEHDLIEEIARIYGYYNLPSQLMSGELPKVGSDSSFYWEDKIKDILVGFGLSEIYTYSFISEKQIVAAGLKAENHIKIANPLSADFEYMRTSLLPGVMQVIADNQGFYPSGKIFDLSKVYLPLGSNDLADERLSLLIATYGKDQNQVLSELKGVLDGLWQRLNIVVEYINSKAEIGYGNDFAKIMLGDEQIGVIGIISSKSAAGFGIKRQVAVAQIEFSDVIVAAKTVAGYQPIAKFPNIELDLSMEIDRQVPFADVVKTIKSVDAEIIERVEFLSVYEGDPKASGGAGKITAGKKALAIRLSYRAKDKTLELAEAQADHEKVVAKLKKSYNIVVR